MSKRAIIFSLIILASVGLGGYLAYHRIEGAKPLACEVCLRPIHEGQAYRVELTDGSAATSCCPRCGIHHQLEHLARVAQAWATDHTTREWVAAERAYYVEGSDARYCNPHPAPLREPGVVYEMTFDRCLPSLIAFRTAQEAQAFHARQGGRVLSYREAVQSVKRW